MPNDLELNGPAVLRAVRELRGHYRGFPWESEVWAKTGHLRSPYRVLLLFGLSPKTKDRLLVEVCRSFFEAFPDTAALMDGWCAYRKAGETFVRKGQIPFVESVALALWQNSGKLPEDRDSLLSIRGVGEKIAECVLGYGWGQEALPIDGNGCRVIQRLRGVSAGNRPWSAGHIRESLKALYRAQREWMAALGVSMIDLHELLRLHGQVLCTKRPRCGRCPVSACASRREAYSGPNHPGIDGTLWRDWRDLLLTPG